MSILTKASEKFLLYVTMLISFGALGVAYFAEYYLGLIPCPLCLYQRVPFFVLIFVCICGLLVKKYRLTIVISTLIFAGGSVLAAYHSGVEHGVFEASNSCKGGVSIPQELSTEEALELLYKSDAVACTKPAIKVGGLSMTEWNFILNLFMMISFIIFLRRNVRLPSK